MEVDAVTVTSLKRDTSILMADNQTIEVFAQDEAEIEFFYLINKQSFKSKTWLIVGEDKTIKDIEGMIKDMMNKK